MFQADRPKVLIQEPLGPAYARTGRCPDAVREGWDNGAKPVGHTAISSPSRPQKSGREKGHPKKMVKNHKEVLRWEIVLMLERPTTEPRVPNQVFYHPTHIYDPKGPGPGITSGLAGPLPVCLALAPF